MGVGGDVGDELGFGGVVGGEGEDGFDFGVFGEGFGGVEGDGGASEVELIGALFGGGEDFAYAVGIAEVEVCRVDEDSAAGVFRFDFEAVEDGLWEGLADGEALQRIGGGAAEALIGFDEENFGAGALEVEDFSGGDLAAVEEEVVGAGSVGEGVGIEEVGASAVGVEVRDLEVELAGLGIPVERKEAVEMFHAGGFGGDGCCGRTLCGEGRGKCCGEGDEGQGRADGHVFVLHQRGGGGDAFHEWATSKDDMSRERRLRFQPLQPAWFPGQGLLRLGIGGSA